MLRTIAATVSTAAVALSLATMPGATGATAAPGFRAPVVVSGPAAAQTGEPSTVVDGKGRIHIGWHSDKIAPGSGPLEVVSSWCVRSDNGGATFLPPVPCDVSGSSNGDPWLAADPKNPDHLYYASLNFLASAGHLSQSFDGGRTWATKKIVANTGVDREWVVVDRNGVVYYGYHDIGPELIYLAKSLDGGATWQPGGTPVATGYPVTTNVAEWGDVIPNTNQGPPAIHPGDPNTILYPYLYSSLQQNTVENQNLPFPWGDLSNAAVAVSTDGGVTWTNKTVFRGPEHSNAAYALPSAAIDDAGNMYMVFAQDISDTPLRWHIYLMRSADGGQTWDTKPIQVDAGIKNAAMPHIVAGSDGRIGIAFYGTLDDGDPRVNDNADWDTYYATSLDAMAPAPQFTMTKVSTRHAHHGRVCPLGLACSSGRDLHDLFDLRLDAAGGANIPWTDTSGNNKATAATESQIMFSCQTSGPSLYAAKGAIAGCGKNAAVAGVKRTRPAPVVKPAREPLPATGVRDGAAIMVGLAAMAAAATVRRFLVRP